MKENKYCLLYTSQVTVLMLLALCVGQMRGTVDDATVEDVEFPEESFAVILSSLAFHYVAAVSYTHLPPYPASF